MDGERRPPLGREWARRVATVSVLRRYSCAWTFFFSSFFLSGESSGCGWLVLRRVASGCSTGCSQRRIFLTSFSPLFPACRCHSLLNYVGLAELADRVRTRFLTSVRSAQKYRVCLCGLVLLFFLASTALAG